MPSGMPHSVRLQSCEQGRRDKLIQEGTKLKEKMGFLAEQSRALAMTPAGVTGVLEKFSLKAGF
jgi:hypothetical protein